MPVVNLYYDRVFSYLGAKHKSKDKLLDRLPYVGLDIEEEAKDYVKVEYSPNRPDFSADVGIICSLRGIMGIEKGEYKLKAKQGKSPKQNYIAVGSSAKKARPFIGAVIARGTKGNDLDNETLRQIIAMQEDLHNGIGRRRKKASIGIHDLDKIKFPLEYFAVNNETDNGSISFVPLEHEKDMSLKQILDSTQVGKSYGNLLYEKKSNLFPVIQDTDKKTISFPPIVNSEHTALKPGTKNILVEVTGDDKRAVSQCLSIVSFVLQNYGFRIELVHCTEPRKKSKNTTPKPSRDYKEIEDFAFSSKAMEIDKKYVNDTIGLDLSTAQIANALKKSRLGALQKSKTKVKCTIPPYRTDVISPIDLVEEVALGYGIENLTTSFPKSSVTGNRNDLSNVHDILCDVMVGLGFSEVTNFNLVGEQMQYVLASKEQQRTITQDKIAVLNSKSQEHTILRDALLPGLVGTLSRNIHEAYPQRLFEIGNTFQVDPAEKTTTQKLGLGCVLAHENSSYTEVKSVLQALIKSACAKECKTKKAANQNGSSSSSMFIDGRTADIVVNDKWHGRIGEVHPQILENFRIRMPVSAFELFSVNDLISQ